jgi:hypothetical protein
LGLLSLLGGHGIFDRYCNYQALRWYVTETRACAKVSNYHPVH